MGDEITSSSSNEWRTNYKVTYIFENNPLTTANSTDYKGHLDISGLTHYTSSKESSALASETSEFQKTNMTSTGAIIKPNSRMKRLFLAIMNRTFMGTCMDKTI